MKSYTDLKELNNFIAENEATMVYFSHDECSVCKVLKPKLIEHLAENYPKFKNAYVDIREAKEISGQYQMFTVPTIVFYLNGTEVLRKSRNFGVDELSDELGRPYSLMFD